MPEAQLPGDAEDSEALPAPESPESTGPLEAASDAPEHRGDDADESVIILPPLPAHEAVAQETVACATARDAEVQDVQPASAPNQLVTELEWSPVNGAPPDAEPIAETAAAHGLAEISPIVSAIEASERTAAAQQSLPNPQIDAFELGLVISRRSAPPNGRDAEIAALSIDSAGMQEPKQEQEPANETEHLASELVSQSAAPEAPEPPAPVAEPAVEDVPLDTAAKIAEEANATAVALEALKQLLADRLPELEAAAARHARQGAARSMPPPLASLRHLHAPVSPPPMLPAHVGAAALPNTYREAPRRRRGAAIGSFLAGFSLSWVVGAVLYMFLTAG